MTTAHPTASDLVRRHVPTEILVAIDFSAACWSMVPLVVDLAARCSIPVRFVHVDTASPWIDEGTGSRLRLRAAPGGRVVDVDVVPGSNVPEGIQALRASSPEAVVALATHGRTGLGELAFGSVCEQLLVTYDAAVLAVGPHFDSDRHAEVRRVVVCVDTLRPDSASLVEGIAWAEMLRVPLTVLSVGGETVDELGDDTYQVIDDIVDRLPDATVRVTAEVLHERDPAPAIVSYAERRAGTLLVLATHARRPLARATAASVTRQVVHEASCGMVLCRATPERQIGRRPLPAGGGAG